MSSNSVENDAVLRARVGTALVDWAALANEVTWPGVLWSRLADESARAVIRSAVPAWETPEKIEMLGASWPKWVVGFAEKDTHGRYGVFNVVAHTAIARDLHALAFGVVAEGPTLKEITSHARSAAARYPEWERAANGAHALDRAHILNRMVVEENLFGDARMSKIAAAYVGVGEISEFGLLPSDSVKLGPGWGGTYFGDTPREYAATVADSARVGVGRLGKAFTQEERILGATKEGKVAQSIAPYIATLPLFTVSELSRRAGVSYNSADGLLKELERSKLVERSKHDKSGTGAVFVSPLAKELYATPASELLSGTGAALAWARKVARVPALQESTLESGPSQRREASPRRAR